MSPQLFPVGGSPAAVDADAVVIGLVSGESDAPPRLAPGADELDAAFEGQLAALLAVAGATGKADEVVKLPTRGALRAPLLVAVGLGKEGEGLRPEQVRRASGAAARALAGTDHAVSTLGRADRAALAAAAEGSLLGAYAFTTYRTNGNRKAPLARLSLATDAADADEVLRTAAAVSEAVRTARDLVNTPPNDLYPETFAARARELAEAAGLEVEVLDDAALAEAGFGGVLGVGQGSSRKPRLVRLRWAGGASPRAHVALVGKGITFDTGGISIKPAANMDHMTSDMSGAAAVIATTVLAATLELPVAVTATVPMAENMPSDTAYRPGDVLRMYGGKTVEVLNTDAEGRLVLADGIARASEDKPDLLIDVATLTGAQLVALGSRTSGVMANDAALRTAIVAAAESSGEQMWPMPLPVELRTAMESTVADISNMGDRYGGMLTAGLFLKEFVGEGIRWAHLDIAGPSFNDAAPHGYTAKGGTGHAVRTLVRLAEDLAAGDVPDA